MKREILEAVAKSRSSQRDPVLGDARTFACAIEAAHEALVDGEPNRAAALLWEVLDEAYTYTHAEQ